MCEKTSQIYVALLRFQTIETFAVRYANVIPYP